MAAPLRPLSTGELLDKTFTLYRTNFLLFYGIAALAQGVVFLILLVGTGLIAGSGRAQSTSFVATTAILGVVMLLVYVVGSLIATAVMQAATTIAVSDLYLDKPTGIKLAYDRVKGRVWRMVDVVFSVGLRIGIGFVLFIVPGVLMLMRYSLAVPAAVLENLKTREALRRSKELSAGSGGRVLTVYILMAVLIWVVSIGLTFASAAVLGGNKQDTLLGRQVLQQLISFIAATIAYPVLTIALALLYYDQRVRKEAFDIEHMISALQPGTGAASAAAAASSSV